ncbi:unnamed protein product [Cylicocyclus nassatus]|uniref:Uncharacterized protein n=1 Tax=Cylicocyclus nassatus TaxID=53992 RepID=A0AA36DNU6_CYLNA|nr:unnamed protein product [Cylicocyclus nassatus]
MNLRFHVAEASNFVALAIPLLSCISLLCTLFTAYQTWRYRQSVDNAENQVMGLLDEALQNMLPVGVCKRICQPNLSIPLDNNDSKVMLKKQSAPKQLEYPEDVSVPIADEDEVYDTFGLRKSEANLESTCQQIIALALRSREKTQHTIAKGPMNIAPTTKTERTASLMSRTQSQRDSERKTDSKRSESSGKRKHTSTTPKSEQDTRENSHRMLKELSMKYTEKTCVEE